MNKHEERANEALKEFIRYSSSPWRLVWTNFVAGIFRGLGAIIGASLIIALFLWLLTLFVDIPLIGDYAAEAKKTVIGYVNDTNYNDEFERMSKTLENIEKALTEKETENNTSDKE